MSVKREVFSEEYYAFVSEITEFVNKYNIQTKCADCRTELEITAINIHKEWDSYTIITRAYCSECQSSRNYYKVIV